MNWVVYRPELVMIGHLKKTQRIIMHMVVIIRLQPLPALYRMDLKGEACINKAGIECEV